MTAVVSVKNEERAITRCLESLGRFAEIIVVDSNSSDQTAEIARGLGATVVPFEWNGQYPKKKQWCLDNLQTAHDWVLFVDGDERATDDFADEVSIAVASSQFAAYDVGLDYHFGGRRLRHGHQVTKRVLLRKDRVRFPVIDDLGAPGMGELEGHYQPQVTGGIGKLAEKMIHDDPDPVASWVERHNRYSDWEAYLERRPDIRSAVRGNRTLGGRIFDRFPLKGLTFFLYAYVVRRGFLDGRAGFDHAYGLAFYYWLIDCKTRELARIENAGEGSAA